MKGQRGDDRAERGMIGQTGDDGAEGDDRAHRG